MAVAFAITTMHVNRSKILTGRRLIKTLIDVAGNHMNCDKPFDGFGGELAHSWAAGDIHFDDDEEYRSDQQLVDSGWSAAVGHAADDGGISLQKLAVHEVGHVLGLLHNDIQRSIMYPIYVTPSSPEDFELVREDRQAVQQIYGVCKVLLLQSVLSTLSLWRYYLVL